MHNPTEHVQEHITHEAAHGGHDEHGHGHHDHSGRWITGAALTAAFLAAFAALAGAQATHHLTESTLKRIEANDNWTYYQSKSVKRSEIDTRILQYNIYRSPLQASAPVPPAVDKQHKDDLAKKTEYADESNPDSMPRIQERAKGLEEVSKLHLETHETYELAATIFHISIAIVAVAVVAKRKTFWYISLALGVAGILCLGRAYVHAPAVEKPGAEEAATPAAGAEASHAGKPEHTTPAEHSPAAERPAAEPAASAPAEH